MIDFHCHLDLYPKPHEIVAQCIERQLYVLSVTTVPSAFEGTAALTPDNGRIRTALGLHPEIAVSREHELRLFEKLLPRTSYVGEVGLDASPDHRATIDRQSSILAEILKLCARAGGRIVTLHSRGATGLLLDRLAAEPPAGRFILHWYLGSAKQISRASEMKCWFSIGPAMFASKRGVSAVAAMPRDYILPESDGPFGLVAGRPALPWEAWTIAPKLAKIWRESQGEVEAQLLDNFRRLIADNQAILGRISTAG
jgi:TatD DNase family protein